MSNPQPQTPTPPKSPTSSTPKKGSKAAAQEEKPEAPPLDPHVEKYRKLLDHVFDFLAPDEAADPHDVRIMWDLTIVSGEATKLGRIRGTSNFTQMISPTQLHLSAKRATDEMLAKVVAPMAALFQDLINKEVLKIPEKPPGLPEPPAVFHTGLPLGEDLAVEAELISSQGQSQP